MTPIGDDNVPPRPTPLDYARPAKSDKPWSDRVALLAMAAVAGLIAAGILVATVELWIATWPSFGLALLAAPIGLVAAAFGSIAFTAVRVALRGE